MRKLHLAIVPNPYVVAAVRGALGALVVGAIAAITAGLVVAVGAVFGPLAFIAAFTAAFGGCISVLWHWINDIPNDKPRERGDEADNE